MEDLDDTGVADSTRDQCRGLNVVIAVELDDAVVVVVDDVKAVFQHAHTEHIQHLQHRIENTLLSSVLKECLFML